MVIVNTLFRHEFTGDYRLGMEVTGIMSKNETDRTTVDGTLTRSYITQCLWIETKGFYGFRRGLACKPLQDFDYVFRRFTIG